MSADLPALSRSAVRNWTLDRYYERGENYHRQGRIQRPRREERLLKAECQGSQPNPYHVEVELDADGIAWGECSCPVGSRCKHTVALLLTWVESPEKFASTDPLEATLQEQSPDTLVQIILKMVDRHPDLERLARLASTSPAAAIDEEEVRRQIQSAFESVSYGGYGRDYNPYSATYEITDDLEPFFTMAEDYADNDRLGDAATVYRLLAEETQDCYSDFHDEDGELANLVSECARHLGGLLSRAEETALRKTILRTLFDIYTWDLELGGYGIGDWAYEAIVEEATPQERERVAEWVREHLPSLPSDSDRQDERRVFVMSGADSAWSTNWKREALGGFLLDLQRDTLDDDTYLRICRQTGRITDLVDRLLKLDRLDDALDVVREASDYEVYQCTSIFTEHGAGGTLHDLVLDRLNDSTDQRLVEWLRDYAETHDNLDRALDLSTRLFRSRPSPDRYQRLRSVAERMGRWTTVQSDLHEQLRENREYALLTRLHLADGDVEAALETVPKVDNSYSWSYDRSSLQIEVAKAAEEEYPEEAIRLYTERGRSLIAERGRDNYRQAAELYERAKALFDDPQAWTDLIESLYEEELHRLPAGQDEFEKAGLL